MAIGLGVALSLAALAPTVSSSFPAATSAIACPAGSATPERFAEWYQRALELDAELYPPPADGEPRPLPEELVEANLALLCNCGSPTGTCVEDDTTLCLGTSRFEVRAAWETPAGGRGQGRQVKLTGDTGVFWFFQDSNLELIVKVLDACSFVGRYWVFGGGLTNVGVELTVHDTVGQETRTYVSRPGTPFQPIQDTNAFPSCP